MSNLREALERRNIEDTNELNRRLQEMQARFQNLEQHCKDLEDHVRELEEKEARRVAMQEEAVIKATNELRQEIDEESKHTRSLMLAENKRVNEDAHNQIQLNNRRFEVTILLLDSIVSLPFQFCYLHPLTVTLSYRHNLKQ